MPVEKIDPNCFHATPVRNFFQELNLRETGEHEQTLKHCQKISLAGSSSEIRRILAELVCQNWGFLGVAFYCLGPGQPMGRLNMPHGVFINTYPYRFIIDYFMHHYYKCDWVINHCRSHNQPSVWDIQGGVSSNIPKDQQALAALYQEHGIQAGVAVPIHAVPCRGALMAITNKSLKEKQKAIAQMAVYGSLIGMSCHDALLNISCASHHKILDPHNLRLTERERSVMLCLVQGMGYRQVSETLNVSVKAIEKRVDGVRRKLNAPSLSAALVMCHAAGLLSDALPWELEYAERVKKLSKNINRGLNICQEKALDYLDGGMDLTTIEKNEPPWDTENLSETQKFFESRTLQKI